MYAILALVPVNSVTLVRSVSPHDLNDVGNMHFLVGRFSVCSYLLTTKVVLADSSEKV